jgi:UDPglucose--hexose-1-phosphate uridylyltransferase
MNQKGSQLRRDSHHGGWVLLAQQPEREQLLSIPRDQWPINTPNVLADPEGAGAHVIWKQCSAMPDGSEHTVKVIANRHALYRVEGDEDRVGQGMYDQMRGIGAQEIIIESPHETDTLTSLTPYQYAMTLQAIQDRIRDLRRDDRLHSYSVFREWLNTTEPDHTHPHTQLISSAIVPLGLNNEIDASRTHYEYKERCLFCDMIHQEIRDEKRIVTVSDEYIAYCPFASRYPFEVHLFSRQHQADYSEVTNLHLPTLAGVIRDIAMRYEKAIPGWRIMMVLHTAPYPYKRRHSDVSLTSAFHWHIEFLPMPPGFIDWYARTGTHVECTPPEKAAAYMRELDIPPQWE